MTVDYDLIVVGNAPVGRYAALRANQTGARVALVTDSSQDSSQACGEDRGEDHGEDRGGLELPLLSGLLAQLNQTLGQQNWLRQWRSAQTEQGLVWPRIASWVTTLAETLEISTVVPTSLSHLMVSGVDVIQARAEFCQRPRLGLFAERLLRARAYLLTPLPRAILPPIPGLDQFATCDDWLQRWPIQPASLVILGTDPRGLLLAQVLNRLGTQVTLLTQRDRLLAEPDLSRALQLQLEAEGITVLTRTEVRQIQSAGDHSNLRLINLSEHIDPTEQGLEAEAILLASQPYFDLAPLHLEQAGVGWQPSRIPVNQRLQTSQPRIYACGSLPEQAVAPGLHLNAEAEIALHNALFWPPKSVNRTHLQFLPTDPEIAWVGVTEAEARRQYGTAIRVAHPLEKSLLAAQISDRKRGFVKLIVHQDGRLLGAEAMGQGCVGLVPVAIALQQNLKLKHLAQMLSVAGSSDLLRQAVQDLQQQSPRWRRELIEIWFDFRRSR